MCPRRVDRAPAPPRSTRDCLILAAERLFGRYGVEGVSLRQIAAEAGAANNSAVHYHFGSKESLAQAIFEYRLPQLMQRRRLLAVQREPGLRGCMEQYLLPLVELAELGDCCYLTFLEQLQGSSFEDHPFSHLPKSFQEPHEAFMQEAMSFLAGVPVALRARRVDQAAAMCVHASADRERAQRLGAVTVPFALHVSELFDAIVGLLLAPVSKATLRLLRSEVSATVATAVVP
jgi:AcrR family transcriptional regulator